MITKILILVLFLIPLMFFWRNSLVFRERDRMIDWIYKQEDWQEKRNLLKSPTYDEMVYKFWKPVGSFYREYLRQK